MPPATSPASDPDRPEVSAAFLRRSVIRALVVANTFRPLRRPLLAFLPSFFTSWIAGEAPLQTLAWNAATTGYQIRRGALRSGRGRLAVGLNALAAGGLVALYLRNRRSARALDAAVRELGIVPEPADAPISLNSKAINPFSFRRKGIAVTRGITYAEIDGHALKLDVTAPGVPPLPGTSRPALIQVHGGAWIIGDKREQGLPLVNHMAANGWVCFNVNYRLGPRNLAPAHIIDVKAAIAWVRDHADEYGIDPQRIAITGGSAGGHLCALAALTSGDPAFQPGFESADTSVMAAVPFYGVYDLTDEDGTNGAEFVDILDRLVIGVPLQEDRPFWESYSPIHRVHPDAPPFFCIEGEMDTLVPVAEARRFVARLREVSSSPVGYAEVPGAQHAFDVFHSPRTNQAIESVRAFLDHVAAKRIGETPAGRSSTVSAPTEPMAVR